MPPNSTHTPCPLVVVGGGKAGMAAAREAAHHGLPSFVLDEKSRPGTLPDDDERIRVLSGTSVLNISSDREILWARGGRAGRFRADQIILATGSVPRIVPFPGWTLPGVGQAADLGPLLATGAIGPGQRALVAGTEFDALFAAVTLSRAGVDVVAVLITGSGKHPVKISSESEAIAAGLDVRYGYTIVSARGHDHLQEASFGPVEPGDWKLIAQQESTIPIEWLVLGFGQVARTELAILAGCKSELDAVTDSWMTSRDDRMRTTVPGIFVIGDRVLCGDPHFTELPVEFEGRIAGITAAEFAGKISQGQADDERAARREFLNQVSNLRLARYAQATHIRTGMSDLADDATVVCRCEGVTCGQVRSAVEEGARDVSSVKLLTRLGMGECQGRDCSPPAAMLIGQLTGRSSEHVGRINPRPPVRPVPLGALANLREGPPLDEEA